MKIGRVTISDRASAGICEDLSGPAIEESLRDLPPGAHEFVSRLVADTEPGIADALLDLADREHCELIVTTGGTGPSLRDVTPEATRQVLEKELPGFGEIMRRESFAITPTAILSRAIAGIRGRSLIVNLPGNPKAVRECLRILSPAIVEGTRHLREG
ncbi:MAG: molybdopterin adenylyltransferase [Terrimicrobiaceae bacterium]|nr:molybdopterin adenylyltransferase [Terrimicrobiaceae bacterium]